MMSRSGYSDDCDNWDLIRWRGAVKSAIRGNRGQRTLKEIADALDSMPRKELAAGSLVTEEGEFCTLGVLGCARSLDMAGRYNMSLRCCQIRYVMGMPKERRQVYYAKTQKDEGEEAMQAVIQEVNEAWKNKRREACK